MASWSRPIPAYKLNLKSIIIFQKNEKEKEFKDSTDSQKLGKRWNSL